jgi:2-amino-4-hydroxy-6-hydroxymethyldihydropteridine diphosphokinase
VNSTRHHVLLGLGANLVRPLEQIAAAVGRLSPAVEAMAVSSLYRSEPVGFRDQPRFYNVVVSGRTELGPGDLLREIRGIEDSLGRVRSLPNRPRLIDIDILAFDSLVIESPDLVIPHPRLHERAFVLLPLQEVAPMWKHPVLGMTPGELIARAGALEAIELAGPLPRVG